MADRVVPDGSRPVLEGRTVAIAGAGRGLGRALAVGLAEAGASIALADPGVDLEGRGGDTEPVEETARRIRDRGGRAFALASDLAEEGAADAFLARAQKDLGGLHGVVVTAGVRRLRTVSKASDEDLEAALEAPLRAAFRMTRAAARALTSLGEGGSIVLFSGPQAFFGAARHALTSMADGAVVGLTRSAAVELRRHRVRVNAIVPTARTRMTEELPTFQGVRPDSLGPEHVVPVVSHLLSEAAREITGEVIGVAGTRVYGVRAREATGAFAEDGAGFTVEELGRVWNEVTRT